MFETRLKKLKNGKLNEFKKKLKDKQNEVDVLKDMVVSSKWEIKAKEINNKKLMNRIKNLEKINGVHNQRA